jgi:uncharacterized protein (UPF0335 family)
MRGNMADFGGIAGEQLKSLIERIERLEEEKRALGEDIKEVYAEAKGTGFEPKIMRQLIKIRKMDKDEHDEQESLLERGQLQFEFLQQQAESGSGSVERVSTRSRPSVVGRCTSRYRKAGISFGV